MSTPQKSNSSGKYKVTAAREARKLGNSESGWNLAGTAASTSRARRAASRYDNDDPSPATAASPRQLFGVVFPPQQERNDDDSTAVSSLTADSSSSKAQKRPPHTRVMIEVDSAVNLVKGYLQKCPLCSAQLSLSFPTTCVASGCRISCVNEFCTFADIKPPSGSELPLSNDTGSEKIERNTDYSANILYVLSFIASGDGGTEAARLLGLLGLPNSTTMQSRSFGNIERGISNVIHDYTDEILMENVRNEVSLKFGDKTDDNGVLLFDRWVNNDLPEDLWPRIDGCADMGWQQKGSGRKRNSKSRHALIIGMLSRKALAKSLCSKGCGFCKTWFTNNSINDKPPKHRCFINFTGTSSGSMEPIAVLEMYKWLYDRRVIVERFVADDDSSIKAKLKWSNENHKINTNTTTAPKIINGNGNLVARPNHGGVPAHMPEPAFVADPNHRRKTLANELYKLLA